MKNLNLKTLFVAIVLMFVSLGVNAQTDLQKVKLAALARQRVQTLSENLKLNEVQREGVYNIQVVYAEKLFNELREEGEALTVDSFVAVMKEQAPDAVAEIKALLTKKQIRRYDKDLKRYKTEKYKK